MASGRLKGINNHLCYGSMKTKHTKHGKLRAGQRVGVPRGIAAITIRNAWNYGIQLTELDNTCELYKWALSHQSTKTPNLRFHGQHLYLFSESIKAVTVLNIPEDMLEEFTGIWDKKKEIMKRRNAQSRKAKNQSVIKKPISKQNTVSLIIGTPIENLRIIKKSHDSLKRAGFRTLGDFLGRKNTLGDSNVVHALEQYGIVPDEKGIFRLSSKIERPGK